MGRVVSGTGPAPRPAAAELPWRRRCRCCPAQFSTNVFLKVTCSPRCARANRRAVDTARKAAVRSGARATRPVRGLRPKRCPLCRSEFSPTSGRQLRCAGC
jgi:hypothetical protein